MKATPASKFIWLSIFAAVVTIGLKTVAYVLTGSVGLLSDAAESIVNLVAAVIAMVALRVAERPPDAQHTYGHTKAEYFASISEGLFILIAAATIVYAAITRLFHPMRIEQPIIGVLITTVASLINFGVAMALLRASRRHRSITLEADAHHLLTDVWTSAGVIAGILIIAVTNIQLFDPIIALLVSTNIVITGIRILKQSALGFMDTALPQEDLAVITQVLGTYCKNGITYHGLRSRESASRRFLSFHILVPGSWSVRRGHDLLEKIEKDIRSKFEKITITTHLEPLEDPRSKDDISIDRK